MGNKCTYLDMKVSSALFIVPLLSFEKVEVFKVGYTLGKLLEIKQKVSCPLIRDKKLDSYLPNNTHKKLPIYRLIPIKVSYLPTNTHKKLSTYSLIPTKI